MSKLQEIRERWAKATPGPWCIREVAEGILDVVSQPQKVGVAEDLGPPDAEAIAAAPSDIEWLLKRVERLEAALRETVEKRSTWEVTHHGYGRYVPDKIVDEALREEEP